MKKFLKMNANRLSAFIAISLGSYLIFGKIGLGIWLIFLGLMQLIP